MDCLKTGLLIPSHEVPQDHAVVYLITNLINGKVYVGQTWRGADTRWKGHISSSENGDSLYFARAIRKYGKENFSLGILSTAADQDSLNVYEKRWIALLNSSNKKCGYNLDLGGSNGRHGAETCEKISEIRKEEWRDPMMREKRTVALSKVRSSPDFKAKQQQNFRERWEDPEFKEMMLAAMHTPEALESRSKSSLSAWQNPSRKEHISQTMKEVWTDPSYREKVREHRTVSMSTPEYRQQQSEGTSALWQSSEYRAKIAKSYENPETKKKLSESGKTKWKNPIYAEKMSRIHREQWADPKFREAQMAKREETKIRKEQDKNLDKSLLSVIP